MPERYELIFEAAGSVQPGPDQTEADLPRTDDNENANNNNNESR